MVREAIANALPPPRKKVVGTGPVFQGANSESDRQAINGGAIIDRHSTEAENNGAPRTGR
jgi:hypothetical protein